MAERLFVPGLRLNAVAIEGLRSFALHLGNVRFESNRVVRPVGVVCNRNLNREGAQSRKNNEHPSAVSPPKFPDVNGLSQLGNMDPPAAENESTSSAGSRIRRCR
jgi:hypothetical protein